MNEEMHQTLQDPLLKQLATRLDQTIPARHRNDYQAMLAAGMKLMFHKRTNHFIREAGDRLTGGVEDLRLLVQLGMKVVETLNKSAANKLNMSIAYQAALVLAAHGLDYFDRIQKITVTEDFLAEFTTKFSGAFLKLFNIKQKDITRAIQQGRHSVMTAPVEGELSHG